MSEKPDIDADRLAQWMTAARSIAIERARQQGYSEGLAAGRLEERQRAAELAEELARTEGRRAAKADRDGAWDLGTAHRYAAADLREFAAALRADSHPQQEPG